MTTTRCCFSPTSCRPDGWRAENAEIEPGDTVAVWGCGPVGLFAIQSALIMGAHRVIAIDHFRTGSSLRSNSAPRCSTISEVDVREALDEMTGGIGPDACIDCVGMESHGLTIDNILDTVKTHTFLGTDRPHALRQVIIACRKGGRVSIPGVYGGFADKFPLGAMMEKGLTSKPGRPTSRNIPSRCSSMIEQGKIDTTFLISHHAPLEDAPEMYRHWHDEQDEYTKIVLKTYGLPEAANRRRCSMSSLNSPSSPVHRAESGSSSPGSRRRTATTSSSPPTRRSSRRGRR